MSDLIELGFVPVVHVRSFRDAADRTADRSYHEAVAGNRAAAASMLRALKANVPVSEIWEIDEDGTGRTRTRATDADLERVAQDFDRTADGGGR